MVVDLDETIETKDSSAVEILEEEGEDTVYMDKAACYQNNYQSKEII